jgi:hypothetical protein
VNVLGLVRARLVVALALASLPLLAGCSVESSESSKPGGSPDDSSSESSFTCCINGVRHVCPDKDAFDTCAGFDMDACMSSCNGDPACADGCFDQLAQSEPDPSACVEDGDCGDDEGGTSSGSSGGEGGTDASTGSGSDCVDESAFCESDYDCCSTVCTNGFCQEAEGTCLGDGGFCDTGLDCCSVRCDGGFCVGD